MEPESPVWQADSLPPEPIGNLISKDRIQMKLPLLQLHPALLYPPNMVGFPGGSADKEPVSNAGNAGSISGSRKSPGEGTGDPLQYPCLQNYIERGAWWATVHGVANNQTRLTLSLHQFSVYHVQKALTTFPFSLEYIR